MTSVTWPAATMETQEVQRTTCCIVGGGPAGAVLALLLVRQGIPVTLLEAHKDFDREFRGDTVHPSTLEILDEIGLANDCTSSATSKLLLPPSGLGKPPLLPLICVASRRGFPTSCWCRYGAAYSGVLVVCSSLHC